MHIIYWLISENYKQTYIGHTDSIKMRLVQHKNGTVKSTKNFGKFRCFILEEVANKVEGRKREKYWKSAAGRKKLKEYYNKIKNTPPSSNG